MQSNWLLVLIMMLNFWKELDFSNDIEKFLLPSNFALCKCEKNKLWMVKNSQIKK